MKAKAIIAIFSLLFVSVLANAQKWEAYGKGLSMAPNAACVFKDKIVIAEESDSGHVLKEVNETGVTEGKYLGMYKSCTLIPAKDILYILGTSVESDNFNHKVVYQWDGQNLKNITPKDSIVNIYNAVYFDNKLYVCGKFNDMKPELIQIWNGSTWEKENTGNESTYDKKFFVFNGKLHLIGNDFDGKTTVSCLSEKKWKRVVSGNYELYTPFSVVEYQGKMVIYDGQNNIWFSFDGKQIKKESWSLKFDNYGSSEMILLVYNNSLYLLGHFWCEFSEIGNALIYDGKKWKPCGEGLSESIYYAFEYKGSIIALGEISKSGELDIKNIARLKDK